MGINKCAFVPGHFDHEWEAMVLSCFQKKCDSIKRVPSCETQSLWEEKVEAVCLASICEQAICCQAEPMSWALQALHTNAHKKGGSLCNIPVNW